MTGAHGHMTEEDVRQIAARLGVADFVFTVPLVVEGSRTREVGDALLIANGLGAVIQVKSRDPEAAGNAENWIRKHAERAARQGSGSAAEIVRRREAGVPLVAFPVKAADLPPEQRAATALALDHAAREWPTIVVIDHPDAVGVVPPVGNRVFWITLDDWHELNRAIRSTTGVLTYVGRILDHGGLLDVPLGHELERFKALVEADIQFAQEGTETSRPWLSFDALEDALGAELFRQLLDWVWPRGHSLPEVSIEDVRLVLEFLDATPPGVQVSVGRWILSKRNQSASTGKWSSGSILLDKERLIVFAADHASNYDGLDEFDAELAAIGALRAGEVSKQLGYSVRTLAIGHLVDVDGIDYRYIYTPEPLVLPDDIKRPLLHRLGKYDLGSRQVIALDAPPDSPCPCGSGLLFSECQGE